MQHKRLDYLDFIKGFAMLLVIFGLSYFTTIATTAVPQRRGVLWQCAFRSNFAIIGLSLAGALGGDEAMAVAAIVSAFTIPVFNTLGVIALSIFLDGGKPDVKKILINVAKNPLIIAVLLGIAALGIRMGQEAIFGRVVFSIERDTYFLYKSLTNLKAIASPFALLVLGGQFEFSAVKALFKDIVVGTVWRTVITPLLGVGGAVLLTAMGILSCGVNEYPALIALFGSPVAVSSAIMAGSMGNDEQLATQLVVWTSICSMVTVFLLVSAMIAMGLLAA